MNPFFKNKIFWYQMGHVKTIRSTTQTNVDKTMIGNIFYPVISKHDWVKKKFNTQSVRVNRRFSDNNTF